MRVATKNEHIYAEHADLGSPASVRDFCTRFLTEGDQRLDGIVFAHEYAGVGSLFASKPEHEERREAAALATFLIITLLLPALLLLPLSLAVRTLPRHPTLVKLLLYISHRLFPQVLLLLLSSPVCLHRWLPLLGP